jgi:lipopolysaccharide export system protein LptA
MCEASAILHLRKDGTLEMVDASGGVTLKQDTKTITAATLHAAMNERSQMQHAELGGGVALLDTNAERPAHAIANTAKIACDAAGYPASVVMDGAVALTMEERRAGEPVLGRQMGAEHVTLTMERVAKPGRGSRVSAVHAIGGAWARGNSVVQPSGAKPSGLKLTSVAGDDLQLALVQDSAGKDQPQSLSGNGHTRIEQRMPDGTVQTSTGDVLQANFDQGMRGLEIASAEQTGHVEMRSVPGKLGLEPSEGVAERAQLDGAADVLTLSGRPRLTRGDTSVTADTVRMMQQTGDAVASGNVAATFVSASAKAAGAGSGSAVTHAMAQEAVLHRTAETMELKGTDAAPARMWQGASQVEAANLLLDRGKDSMQAWPAAAGGVVRSVFAERQGSERQGSGIRDQGSEKQGSGIRDQGSGSGGQGQGSGPKVQGPEGQASRGLARAQEGERVVRVTSARLDYSGVSHEAVFTGGVIAEGEDGLVRAQRAVAFLTERQGSGIRDQGSGGTEADLSDDKPPQRASSRGNPETVAKMGHPESSGHTGSSGSPTASGKSGSSSGVAKGQPDPVAASLEKIVMSGAVKVEQPGRTATGEQLLYTAATGEFVLTGTPAHPPHVVDEKQGSITGATLLFRSADSTIVVAGEPASRRVHTETTIKK